MLNVRFKLFKLLSSLDTCYVVIKYVFSSSYLFNFFGNIAYFFCFTVSLVVIK